MHFSLQRTGVAALLLATALTGQAQTTLAAGSPALADQGFSYFLGLGAQSIRYRETVATAPIKTSVRTTSPLLVAGGLYAVTPDLMVSLGSESTFFGGTGTESWNATVPTLGGVTLTSPTVQRNTASLMHSETQVLGHWRLADDFFVVGGPTVRTQSFKRHSFDVPEYLVTQGVISRPSLPTVEESTSEVVLNVGAELESGQVKGRAQHYSLRALVGVPVVRRLENTNHPGVRFSGTGGIDLALEGRYSWAVHPGVHLGLWGRWSSLTRSRQVQDNYELPRSQLATLGYGVELLWKL